MEVKTIKSGMELEATKQKGLTLVDFGAPWCAPCHLQEPIIERLADQFAGKASLAMVNIDGNLEMASAMGIRSIPTLILFRNGKEIQRFVGLQSENTLSDAMWKLLQ